MTDDSVKPDAPQQEPEGRDDANPVSRKAQADADSQKVSYSVSPGLAGFIGANRLPILVSSYQSGRFYLLGQNPAGGLMVHERFFQKAMGISVSGRTIHLATLGQIIRFENVLRADQKINNVFDACFVPRVSYTTGGLDAHDVGVARDGSVIFVNTRYNCLATLSGTHSFKPVWRPPFISKLVDEDRCHLNGLAMRDGVPRYVTAVSRSDTIDGWRDRRADGGIVIDVESGRVVCEGLSMPHSPRLYNGQLWVLNSGTGELGRIEPGDGRKPGTFKPFAFLPGFVRGLAFHGKYAFVGLSRPRYERFEGLDLDRRLAEADSEPWTGVQVIDLETGSCVHWFRIDGAVAELYDVNVVQGFACPMALGFGSGDILSLITVEDGGGDGEGDGERGEGNGEG
ncbi:MAG: TIGR03032 family protein [Flavobacteriaceae bacterium]